MPNVLHKHLAGADLHPPGPHTHPDSNLSSLTTLDARSYQRAAVDAGLAEKALASDLSAHNSNVSNPHTVTKAQVGLSNVTNYLQLKAPSNLSDVASVPTSRANLKLSAGGGSSFVVAATGVDYTDIRSALDAITTAGGTIYIADGTYTITTSDGQILTTSDGRYIVLEAEIDPVVAHAESMGSPYAPAGPSGPNGKTAPRLLPCGIRSA